MRKIQIHLKSFHVEMPQKVLSMIEKRLAFANINRRVHMQNTYNQKYTVIRSPHVHKKSREQFKQTRHNLIFSIEGEKIVPFISLLKSGSFYGVQMKTSVKSSSFLKPLGFGD